MSEAGAGSSPRTSPRTPGAKARGRSAWVLDAVIVALIAVVWWCWLHPEVTRRQPVVFDTYRDAAAAENVLAGRWFRDPMTADQPYWYAPLGSMVFAGVGRLTGQPPLVAYANSILWFNLLLPLGWYALARCCWGWRAGVAAVPLIWLGSRWWSYHIALPMTSTQGVVLLMGVLLAWTVSWERRRRWAVAVGVLLAACTWYHTLSGLIAAAAIGCHVLLRWGRVSLVRMLIVGGVCAVLVTPLVWHLLTLDILNPAPIQYVSTLLTDPQFALQTRTWLIFPVALLGLVAACRRRDERDGVLVGYGLVSLIGQAWGYLRVLTDVPVPVLIPHEFQWNFQIAVGLFAARGAAQIAAWAARQIQCRAPGTRVPHILLMLPIVAWILQGDAAEGFRRHSAHWQSTVLSPSRAGAVEWIKTHTLIDDVFLASGPLDYFLVAGRTGRKIVCPPEGHAHLGISWAQCTRDRRRMLETTDPTELRGLLAQYQVRYVLLAEADVACWERWRSWGLFEPVLGGESSSLIILRVFPS